MTSNHMLPPIALCRCLFVLVHWCFTEVNIFCGVRHLAFSSGRIGLVGRQKSAFVGIQSERVFHANGPEKGNGYSHWSRQDLLYWNATPRHYSPLFFRHYRVVQVPRGLLPSRARQGQILHFLQPARSKGYPKQTKLQKAQEFLKLRSAEIGGRF